MSHCFQALLFSGKRHLFLREQQGAGVAGKIGSPLVNTLHQIRSQTRHSTDRLKARTLSSELRLVRPQ